MLKTLTPQNEHPTKKVNSTEQAQNSFCSCLQAAVSNSCLISISAVILACSTLFQNLPQMEIICFLVDANFLTICFALDTLTYSKSVHQLERSWNNSDLSYVK
jgi:hypothetical protein